MPRRKKSPRNTASPQPSPLQVSTFHNVEILNISGGNFVATRASRDTDEGGVGMDSGPGTFLFLFLTATPHYFRHWEGSVKPPHDIYYDQLLVQKKGSPMWIPGPDMNLPKEYKTRGIGIGDVGVLYCAQGFHFLFNIFLPANDPINEGRVPDGFVPLDYSTLRLGMMAQPSQKIEYTSLSVRKSGSLNSWVYLSIDQNTDELNIDLTFVVASYSNHQRRRVQFSSCLMVEFRKTSLLANQ